MNDKLDVTANKQFEDLALSHYGYDGGNLDSSIWFSGIEWGGGISTETLKNDVSAGLHKIPPSAESLDSRKEHLRYQFDIKLLKILSVSLGMKTSDYPLMINEEYKAFSSSGPMFKFNLYPISFRNTSPEHWNSEHYNITGFPTKELYIAWVQLHRFQFFNNLSRKHKPKVIICFGTTFKKDFLMAFGGVESLFKDPINTLHLSGKSNVDVFQSTLVNTTKIIVAPFLGNRYGINKDEECREIGKLIKSLV